MTQRKRIREYLGKYVKLLTDLETKGGDKFPCGTVLLCYSHWKGRLNLAVPNQVEGREIRQVPPSQVMIVGQAKGTIRRHYFLEDTKQ